ncbi:uncharacterized protein LOC119297284 [Triticum dicoccoides]|uniref:uncharacterized protein LOC119297284 n=1 Tax=Triticum dicoccoides TaxID=85692 RepID=UPI0018905297|nr:uncharacterized protein LOC119297284 [Triticum dicoccoides]
MGVRSRRRRKNGRRDASPAATHRLPDELIEARIRLDLLDGDRRPQFSCTPSVPKYLYLGTEGILDKDTAEFSISCFPDDMCTVPDEATRIRVVGGEDGAAVHIAVLTKYFLEVFVQAEDSGKWVSKTRFSLSQAIRELFGDKIKKPHITVTC